MTNTKKGLILITAMLLCMAMVSAALAESTVSFSNTLSIEDVATLAKVAEQEEGATRFSASFLPDDTLAPDSITALAMGSGIPEKIILTRENGYAQTVTLAASSVPLKFTLASIKGYTVTQTENQVHFEITLETREEPLDEAETPFRNVAISANVPEGETLQSGDEIILTGHLEGYDGLTYTLQWQVDKGAGFENIEGANGLSYGFVLDEANYWWYFRLVAIVTQPESDIEPLG